MRSNGRTKLAVGILLVGGVCGCTQRQIEPVWARGPSTQPGKSTRATVAAVDLAGGGRLAVLPPGADSPADLLIHFHGGFETVRREAEAADVSAAIVAVNFKGMSSAYEKPFSDPAVFDTLLHEAWVASGHDGPPAWRRICVSSFSAGYGAVRALLCEPRHAKRIDAIYLADSLYAGWIDEPGASPSDGSSTKTAARRVEPRNMEPFRRCASEAAAGRRLLIITHGYYDPVKYAGTHVTADDLITHVGAQRRTVDEPGPARLRVTSRVDIGELHIFGCEGNTGEDHGEHLRGLRFGFARLPIAGTTRIRE